MRRAPAPWHHAPGNRPPFAGRFGIEDQQHPLACTEEDVPPRLFADEFQSKDIPIECLGLIEIIDVKGGLNEVLYASRSWPDQRCGYFSRSS